MTNNEQKIAEQIDILNHKDKSLIVSASAGSGKTTIMIKKIFNYMLDKKAHANELLVLTYTKAAAEEMKKRLIDKIKENLETHPHLSEELEEVQTSDISTFDSFCQKLVKKYFYILDINPSFSVLEGGDKEYQLGLAIDKAIEELQNTCPNMYELLLENFSPKRTENNIKNLIFKIYSFSTSILNLEEFKEKTYSLYNKELKIAEGYLNSYYIKIFSNIKKSLIDLLNKSKESDFKGYVEYINNLLSIVDIFNTKHNFAKKVEFVKEIDYKALYKDKLDEINLNKQITTLKNKIKDIIDKKIKDAFISEQTINNSYDKCNEIISAIFSLFNIFVEKYSNLKNDLCSYDFDDIERLTIKLLENPIICEEIKNSYKYIFIDEFQDANAIQEKIIFLLENKNLFFVGDTKQSIYGFRQSDPEIFLNIEKSFSKSSSASAKKLNCNFRTNKNILQFVNKIFSSIMTEQTAGINYKQKAQFIPMAMYEDLENEICVSLNIINGREKPQKPIPSCVYNIKDAPKVEEVENTKDQCYFICQKIMELLNTEIYDSKAQTTKKVSFSDFAILITKRTGFGQEIAKTFTEVGIPYVISSNENLESLYDNQVLFNLLKCALNSNDDISLYSILTSSLFNFTNSELALIKQSQESEYFYQAFNDYSKNFNNEISQKIYDFKEKLNTFIFNCKFKGIFYALNNILIETNYLLNISFEDDFLNRRINIEEYINSFNNSKYNFNLTDYINYREVALQENKIETSKASSNAVQITTIHASKGLEYPIVILPNLQADLYRSMPVSTEIKLNKEFGIGVKAYNNSERLVSNGIFYECCSLKEKELEKSEKIRLFYVATTRAKNKLILIGSNAKNYSKFESDLDIMSCNNYLSMVVNSLNNNIINKINLGKNFSCNLFSNYKIELNVFNIVKENIIKPRLTIPPKVEVNDVDKLADYLQKDLSVQKSNIALKNSVSSLNKDENANNTFAPQSLNLTEHLNEKTSDAGTLVHKVLEEINFSNVNSTSDVKIFIECNFSQEEINKLLTYMSYEQIFNNILSIKNLILPESKILKEQKFVMNVPYNQVVSSNITDKILVQGVIDLLVINNNNICLLDYKLSKKTNQQIKETYKKQLDIYSLAISKGFKNFKIKKYILNLYQNELILM